MRRRSVRDLAGAIVASSARQTLGKQEVTVWLSREEIARLSALARAEGADLSQYIRARLFEPYSTNWGRPSRFAKSRG